MADQPHEPGSMDISDQNATYNGVMAFTGKWGAPACLAFTVMVAAFLVNAGFLGAIFSAIITFVFTRWVLMTFFAH